MFPSFPFPPPPIWTRYDQVRSSFNYELNTSIFISRSFDHYCRWWCATDLWRKKVPKWYFEGTMTTRRHHHLLPFEKMAAYFPSADLKYGLCSNARVTNWCCCIYLPITDRQNKKRGTLIYCAQPQHQTKRLDSSILGRGGAHLIMDLCCFSLWWKGLWPPHRRRGFVFHQRYCNFQTMQRFFLFIYSLWE